MNYSKTIIIGHLGKDPEVKNFDNGGKVVNISVAYTEKWKKDGEDKEETIWYRCVLRDKLGEIAEKYLKKGSEVLLSGIMKSREYEKDETKFTAWELHVFEMKLGAKPNSSSDAPAETSQAAPVASSDDDELNF